jgi:hypothetical protein
VSQYYTIDAAEERLPELRDILETLRDQRADLVRLRDKMLERITTVQAGAGSSSATGTIRGTVENDPRIRSLRLRMQGLVDQMQAGVARIDDWSVSLRDIESGLVDFPALVNGRPIWLCWRLGEEGIEWWHEHSTGYSDRQPLLELV